MAKKKKHYAYLLLESNEQGVVNSWPECQSIVQGRQARYRGFPSLEEAQQWLEDGAKYEQKAKKSRKSTGSPGKASKSSTSVLASELPREAIYFDAGTGRGYTEARVSDCEGTPLTFLAVAEDEISPQGNLSLRGRSNNYGELLACLLAMKIAIKQGKKLVMGDSRLVIDYWSKGRIRKETAAQREELLDLVQRVTRLRREFEAQGGQVKHISGDINPADLGFHK